MGRPSSRIFAASAILIALLAFGAFASGASAAPGSLDPSFGDHGHVFAKTLSESAPGEFSAAAREPNGDLVIEARYTGVAEEPVREIQLRTPTGALVRSFGEDGRIPLEGEEGAGPAVLGNGDIVVGTNLCGGTSSQVEVLEPSGAKDASFGKDGCSPEGGFTPEHIVVDPQGRILVSGPGVYCPPCEKDSIRQEEVDVVRLLPDGSRDESFGDRGYVGTHTTFGLEGASMFEGLGQTGIGATAEGGLVLGAGRDLIRLEPDGSLDPDYGTGGIAPAPAGARAIVVEPDGAVAVVTSESQRGQTVSKLTPTGAPDPRFGDAGTLSLSTRIEASAELIAPAPEGGYLIGGRTAPAPGCSYCKGTAFLERVTAAGGIDRGYGKDGTSTLDQLLPRGPRGSSRRALLAAPDGSAIVVGVGSGKDATAVALTPSGAAEKSFGKNGALVEPHRLQVQLTPTGLALAPGDGLTLSNERFVTPGDPGGIQVRFDADGRQLRRPGGARAVETRSNGRLVPVGARGVAIWPGNEPKPAHALVSAGPDGRPIAGFGKKGHGNAKFPKGFVAEGIAAAPDGGILAFGVFEGRVLAAFRIGPDGRPVHGFGDDGLATLPISRPRSIAFDGLVETDGSVVLTGEAGYRFIAVRFLPNGRPDPHYGQGGRVRALTGGGAAGGLIAPSGDGVVIDTLKVVKSRYVSAGLLRLDSHGRSDRTFGTHGFVGAVSERRPLALFTGGGRIVLVNDPLFEKSHKGGGVELRSYKPEGSVDRAFGRNGVRFFGAGSDEEHAFTPAAAVQQGDGRVVVAGTARDGNRSKAELLRFLVR